MDNMDLEQLVSATREALEKNGATAYHLRMFNTTTRALLRYAAKKEVSKYTLEFGLCFLDEHYHMSEKSNKIKFRIIYLHCINELYDVQQKGDTPIYFGKFKREYDVPEGFKGSYDCYLEHRLEIGMRPKSLSGIKLYLERFFQFLIRNNVNEPLNITLEIIFSFLSAMNERYEKTTVCHNMRTIRLYLKYCYENGIISEDFFGKIPNVHYCRQSRLPSVYTVEEIHKLIDSIDHGNPCGKRDYAIILLIARSGLRAGDIANLRFSDVDWENQKIIKTQQKTGNPIELPLLNDVGDAMIDYLKNARPDSESDHIFIKNKPPYDNFGASAVGALVRRLMQRSGIKLENRKCGSHVLRHSLASRLLECDVPMPVISEILGHSNTAATMTYLRIDLANLKTCALEVEV